MLAPALVLFGLFVLYPLVGAVRISLTDSTGIGEARWVGLGNYAELARDPVFWRAAGHTVLLAAVSVPVSLALGLALALLLRDKLPGRGLFRALFLAPYVLSGVVVAMAGRWIFDENIGIVHRLALALHLPAWSWQSSPWPAAASIVLVLLWARTGLAVVLYLSALQGVPADVMEAAELDGASPWQRLRYVVWPLLRPTTFFLTVLLVIETFQVFDLVWVMTGGGPAGGTELLVTYAYGQGFNARREGYGSAIGVVVFVVVLAATALWWRAQRASEDEA
ncbi:sugar ABC transporter permease [Kineococcus glutinatus]|uniref:Sugar ABC transporter permease n=2 Tax=Kineococcus glutinatus TaxID=1070872 RepID=A0ABP9HLT4_9ACTN